MASCTKTLVADPIGPVSYGVRPPWFGLDFSAHVVNQIEIWRISRPSQHLELFVMSLKPFLNYFAVSQGAFPC